MIFDEADLGLELTSDDNLRLLFNKDDTRRREFSRISYLVGATVTELLGNIAVRDAILPEGKSFIATATRFAPITKEEMDVCSGVWTTPHRRLTSGPR